MSVFLESFWFSNTPIYPCWACPGSDNWLAGNSGWIFGLTGSSFRWENRLSALIRKADLYHGIFSAANTVQRHPHWLLRLIGLFYRNKNLCWNDSVYLSKFRQVENSHVSQHILIPETMTEALILKTLVKYSFSVVLCVHIDHNASRDGVWYNLNNPSFILQLFYFVCQRFFWLYVFCRRFGAVNVTIFAGSFFWGLEDSPNGAMKRR